jgi:demethylspheroidene O-methyltransferase
MAKIVAVVLEMYDFSSHTCLFDLCGGTGTFCEAVVRATPGLVAAFIDIPAVAEIGRKRLANNGLSDRIVALGGDVFADELPQRADLMTMCRSAHDWDDARVLSLFRRVFEALPMGGKFLVIERMIPDEFTPRAAPLYLRAIYFLSKSRTACYRTAEQYDRALRQAGFARVETIDPPRDPYEFFQGLRMVVGTKA